MIYAHSLLFSFLILWVVYWNFQVDPVEGHLSSIQVNSIFQEFFHSRTKIFEVNDQWILIRNIPFGCLSLKIESSNTVCQSYSTLSISINRFIGFYSSITRSFIFGDREALEQGARKIFKDLGYYHLVVVSGLHFTILYKVILGLLIFPIRVVYLLRIIPINLYWFLYRIFDTCVIYFMTFYLSFLGTSSAQRAWSFLVGRKCLNHFALVSKHPLEGIYFCLLLHTFIFPVGIFETSRLLSWMFYLLVVVYARSPSFIARCMIYFFAALINLCLWGHVSLLAWVLSPIFICIFPILIMVCFLEVMYIVDVAFVENFYDGFLYLLSLVKYLSHRSGLIFYLPPESLEPYNHLLIMSVIIFLLIALFKFPIRKEEEQMNF